MRRFAAALLALLIVAEPSFAKVHKDVYSVKGDTCEMQVQSTYSGITHHDADDFKARVDASLAQQQPSQPVAPAKP
jgi:hypothetical protein